MRYRIHWPAVVVAMIASFLFEAGYFSWLMNAWLAAIGHDMTWINSLPKGMIPVQFAVALACSFTVATVLSFLIQATGPQTLMRGIKTGVLVWVGFIATSLAKNYIFEMVPANLWKINLTYTLLDMILIGAIVGAWKGKPRPNQAP